jgi:TonB-dependent receptor
LMGTFNVGPRLTVIGGARYEHYNMNYKAHFLLITHAVDGLCNSPDTLNTVDRNDDNLLPNIQLRYKATDWAEVRLAYTNTLVRPDYQAIMPRTYYDPNGSAQAGNPRLKPTVSNNYDANVSFFSNKLGLLTIGGFYKQLDNEFFRTNFYYRNLSHYPNLAFPDSATFLSLGFPAPAGGTQVQTWFNNPNPGFIRGIEVEWQTNFWYLPRPLNALVFNINYTRVWSNMDYLQVINTPVPYIDESGRQRFRYVTTDTIRSARLLGQSDHVLNMALGIDYKGFSGRVSFNLQSNDITTVGTRSEEDVFTGTVYRWDLMLRQKLPIEGLSISLDIQNLTHSPTETYQRFYRLPPAQGGTISDNLASTTYGPSYYQISLRYAL